MQANEIMQRGVITVREDASISDAINLMLSHRISGIPVLNRDGAIAGILTEGDLLRRSETETGRRHSWWWTALHGTGAQAGEYVRMYTRKVADLMTSDVVTASETTPLDEIVDTMESRRVKRLPIVTEDRLVGIVSRSDLLRALAARLPATVVAEKDEADDVLTKQVIAELEKHEWFKRGQVRVEVEAGVVHLEGVYTDQRERNAVRVAVENVPGVKTVADHLEWVDLNGGLMYG